MENHILGLIVVFLIWSSTMYLALRNNPQFKNHMTVLKAFVTSVIDKVKDKIRNMYQKLTQKLCKRFKLFK